jgi:DNA-binding NarL/FixJ family response regulator
MSKRFPAYSRVDKAEVAASLPNLQVGILEDHAFFREGLRFWLDQKPDLEFACEADSVESMRPLLAETPIDVLTLDLGLRDSDALEFIREVSQDYPEIRIVTLSQRQETVFAFPALARGAHAYVMKTEAADVLGEAIATVVGGGRWVSRALRDRLDPVMQPPESVKLPHLVDLSSRELEVLTMIGYGCGPKEVARRLDISVKTVEAHRERMKAKLDLSNSSQLKELATQAVLGS